MESYFQEPSSAAAIAAVVTIAYIYISSKMNGEGKIKNSDYFKPAFLVALLVFFVVSQGQGSHGSVSKDPY
jgi:Na+/pantothenate symporter